MATKSISQLDTVATAHDSDLFEVAAVDGNSATGYSSGKMSAAAIAAGMLSAYTYPTEMPAMQNKTIIGALNTLLSNFAPAYDSTSTYAVGDIVTYNGGLYKCNTTISVAEAWDSTHWDAGTCKDFFEGGGGISAVSKIWFGTQAEYESISVPDDGTMYVIKQKDETYGIFQSIQKIYIGSTIVFPAIKTGYDYWIDDYYVPDNALTYLNYYKTDTGIALNNATNKTRDYEIVFNGNPSKNSALGNIDRVVCGTKNTGTGIREVYFDRNGALHVYEGTTDAMAYSGDASNKDIVIRREGTTLTVSVEGVVVDTRTCDRSESNFILGIGKYSDSYAWIGTLNYFGFRWLN